MQGRIVLDFDDIVYNKEYYDIYLFIKYNWLKFSYMFPKENYYVKNEKEFNKRKQRDFLVDSGNVFYFKKILEKIKNNSNFSKNKITDFFKKVIKNSALENNNVIEEITVICYNEKQIEIIKSFKNRKIKTILLTRNLIKEYLEKNNWNLFVSSDRKLIREIITDKEFNISKKEFLMPSRKYTILKPEENILIMEKEATINYFD